MEWFLIIVVGIIIIAYVVGVQKAKELEVAKQKYLQSLSKLKGDPTNANLKERTLALGRVYSNLTRDKKGIMTIDEVALMNDINAACATASANSSPAASSGQSIEARLRMLSELKEKGLIDDAEYESRRASILGNI